MTTTTSEIMLAGFTLPAPVRSAMTLIGFVFAVIMACLAIAVAALVLPFALFATFVAGDTRKGARRGWQPVTA